MSSVSKIKNDGVLYDIEDSTARADISDLKSEIAQNSGVPREVKQAMDALFEHMAVSSGAGFEAEYLIIHDWASSTARVTSISAVFDQSASITTDNTLNDLKQYLTVTASYSDGTREEVTGYTLSGTLASGTNTITVTYSGKTATFEVTVTGWTLEWDYTDGALPSSDEWTTTEGAGGSHTTTFVSGKGIKWTGTGWSLGYTPTEHTTTTEGTVEFVCNVEDFGTNGSIRATLANGTDCIIAFLTSEGIRVNGGSGELIADTVPSLNTDYTVRVERTATEGKIYFNDTLVYTGALRELSGTNNVLIAKTALSGTMTAYIKSMRFIHIS